jgi:pimeloyl-ACP methyl ester carboxylesterase
MPLNHRNRRWTNDRIERSGIPDTLAGVGTTARVDDPDAVTYQVELPGRGRTRVWECAGPPGAETLILLHGVTLTAELNWGRVLGQLGSRFRVIAFDQRGHGQGIVGGSRFRLEDCADDVAALAGVLGIRRFVVVGYSMGGMVAQLLCRRHPSLVSGLVLCATARSVRETPAENLVSLWLPMLALTTQWNPLARELSVAGLAAHLLGRIDDDRIRQWAQRQLRHTSLATTLSAVQAVCEFSSKDWVGQIGVPTAVVVTTRDQIVPPNRQRELAAAIPGAVTIDLPGDHGVCVKAPQQFAQALLHACAAIEPAKPQRLGRKLRSTITRADGPSNGHRPARAADLLVPASERLIVPVVTRDQAS